MSALYKIKSNKTGLFSLGGSYPQFGKLGKVWKRKGDLSSHFTNLGAEGRRRYRENECMVVEIEIVEIETTMVPVDEYIEASATRTAENKRLHEERVAKWQLENARRNYERLLKQNEGK